MLQIDLEDRVAGFVRAIVVVSLSSSSFFSLLLSEEKTGISRERKREIRCLVRRL